MPAFKPFIFRAKRFSAALALSASLVAGMAMAEEPGLVQVGDAVVTGFSGVIEPAPQDPPLSAAEIIDETLINTDGVSARINYIAAPGFVWDARAWPGASIQDFLAKDVGQVFGVALDDADKPNIYLAASSAYGLHLVTPDADNDGRPERVVNGSGDAQWMEGQWGKADTKGGDGSKGGPGSIWKVDGVTGEVSLFANVELDGQPNSGAGLGNITFVPAFKQLFASDLSTGMIHRFAMDGSLVETYDHGVTGREAAQLDALAYDPATRLDAASPDFDTTDPDTWGFADPDRRVYALAFHEGRLFYSVVGGSQIWSVGFDKDTGKFADPRWELDVPKKPKELPVTDMAFSHKGAMILAQRGEITSTYDYSGFAKPGKARLYRYWPENPDDPQSESRWVAEPEDYAVGFGAGERFTDGGVALGHGYDDKGYLDSSVCEATLWTTGDDLRNSEVDVLRKALTPGGPLMLDGLQGMPAGPVRQDAKGNNTPPWASYMLDNDPDNTELADEAGNPLSYSDERTDGWTGDVAIRTAGCTGVAGSGSYWGGAGYAWNTPDYIDPDPVDTGEDTGDACTPGVDCPPVTCAKPAGQFICDRRTGTWTYLLDPGADPGLFTDTIKITGASPGVSIGGGPLIGAGTPFTPLTVLGASPGQLVSVGLCLFNKAEMQSGKPFTCCKTSVTAFVPRGDCRKQN